MSGQVATAAMWKAARECLDPVQGPLVEFVAEGAAIAGRYESGRLSEPGNRAGALAAIAELAIAGGSERLIDALRWWYIGYHRDRLWRVAMARVGPVGGPFHLVPLRSAWAGA